MSETRRIAVAVTGASGGIYACRFLRALLQGGHEAHLVLSRYGRYILHEEMGLKPDKESVQQFLQRLYGDGVAAGTLVEYGVNDLTSALASGSVAMDGMVVIPCSAKTFAAIACGFSSNLIERAADVALKERRPLILVPRETPLNLIQLRNLTALAEAGATVVPAMPAFYQKPESFDDLADFMAGRVLNLLGIRQELFPAWRQES
jgi:4-hydroxy-3-polyprenylbenzoate decarboxylase